MSSTPPEQTHLWNGPAGHSWVEMQDLTDRAWRPFLELLLEDIEPGSSEQLLDIGCGTGATTVAFASRLGANGSCLGIDISEPMLEAAEKRAKEMASPASFLLADAEHHAFEKHRFDQLLSRFGVMFFSEPARAFANLRSAAAPSGKLRFVAWRDPKENPFMTAAGRAAAPFLPEAPPPHPGFAFADEQYVKGILLAAGWQDVVFEPVDRLCAFPRAELVGFLTKMGPVALFLKNCEDTLRAQILEAMLAAFEPYFEGDEVCFNAACWLVSARA